MSANYLVFSGFHAFEPNVVQALSNHLKSESFDGIIINGDISGDAYIDELDAALSEYGPHLDDILRRDSSPGDALRVSASNQQLFSSRFSQVEGYDNFNYFFDIVSNFARSGLDVFVSPGVFDEAGLYRQAINDVASKFSNVVDCSKYPVIHRRDHELVFIPGMLESEDFSSGVYLDKDGESREFFDEFSGHYIFFNPCDIISKVESPEESLLFISHPPRFDNPGSVDHLGGWLLKEDFVLKYSEGGSEKFEKGLVIYDAYKDIFLDQGASLERFDENEGDDLLRILYKNSGFNKVFVNNPNNLNSIHNWSGERLSFGKMYGEVICAPSFADDLIIGNLRYDSGRVGVFDFKLDRFFKRN